MLLWARPAHCRDSRPTHQGAALHTQNQPLCHQGLLLSHRGGRHRGYHRDSPHKPHDGHHAPRHKPRLLPARARAHKSRQLGQDAAGRRHRIGRDKFRLQAARACERHTCTCLYQRGGQGIGPCQHLHLHRHGRLHRHGSLLIDNQQNLCLDLDHCVLQQRHNPGASNAKRSQRDGQGAIGNKHNRTSDQCQPRLCDAHLLSQQCHTPRPEPGAHGLCQPYRHRPH